MPDPHTTPRSAGPALPVSVHAAGAIGAELRGWVEGVLGWQPVDAATSALVPPALCLVDVPAAVGDAAPVVGVPLILLVTDTDGVVEVAHAGAVLRPEAVLAWPGDRDRLADLADGLLARPRPPASRHRLLRLGGTAGGVGTTTVALAMAGVAGWGGATVLAVVQDTDLARDVRRVPAEALAGAGVWEQATPLPGCPRVRAVRIPAAPRAALAPQAPGAEVVVVDVGVDADVDVLVGRPDAAGLGGFASASAGALVVVGEGPASRRAVARACGPRRVVSVPWSARVARAGLQGRVPAGLPGTWLRRLAPLAPTGPA